MTEVKRRKEPRLRWIKAVAEGRVEPKPWEKAGYREKENKRG